MDLLYRTVVAVFCPVLALLLHELTHIAIAKYQGMTSMKLISVFPQFRIEISYPDTQSDRGMQLMAIAPFVVGVISALIMVSSGLWRQIQLSLPYYIEGIFILSWVAYCHLSPADVRTILNPGRSTPTS
jgi:prepilin signal peptidase PulO-like enzyme (type II secretory pathway)